MGDICSDILMIEMSVAWIENKGEKNPHFPNVFIGVVEDTGRS